METEGQKVVVPIETPIKPVGGLTILRGSLAPDGCVVKTAGVDEENLFFEGPAHVCESQEDAVADILEDRVKAGDVVVVRYEGRWYFPTYGRIHTGKEFGLDYAYEVNYRDLRARFAGRADFVNAGINGNLAWNALQRLPEALALAEERLSRHRRDPPVAAA